MPKKVAGYSFAAVLAVPVAVKPAAEILLASAFAKGNRHAAENTALLAAAVMGLTVGFFCAAVFLSVHASDLRASDIAVQLLAYACGTAAVPFLCTVIFPETGLRAAEKISGILCTAAAVSGYAVLLGAYSSGRKALCTYGAASVFSAVILYSVCVSGISAPLTSFSGHQTEQNADAAYVFTAEYGGGKTDFAVSPELCGRTGPDSGIFSDCITDIGKIPGNGTRTVTAVRPLSEYRGKTAAGSEGAVTVSGRLLGDTGLGEAEAGTVLYVTGSRYAEISGKQPAAGADAAEKGN